MMNNHNNHVHTNGYHVKSKSEVYIFVFTLDNFDEELHLFWIFSALTFRSRRISCLFVVYFSIDRTAFVTLRFVRMMECKGEQNALQYMYVALDKNGWQNVKKSDALILEKANKEINKNTWWSTYPKMSPCVNVLTCVTIDIVTIWTVYSFELYSSSASLSKTWAWINCYAWMPCTCC